MSQLLPLGLGQRVEAIIIAATKYAHRGLPLLLSLLLLLLLHGSLKPRLVERERFDWNQHGEQYEQQIQVCHG